MSTNMENTNTKILGPLLGWIELKANREELQKIKDAVEKTLKKKFPDKPKNIDDDIVQRVFEALKQQRKLDAVKDLKDWSGLGLKESLSYIDKFQMDLKNVGYFNDSAFNNNKRDETVMKQMLQSVLSPITDKK